MKDIKDSKITLLLHLFDLFFQYPAITQISVATTWEINTYWNMLNVLDFPK